MGATDTTGHHWPIWDIRIRTPRLELRPLAQQEMFDLVEVMRAGIHDPADMPFLNPFTDLPSPERERNAYRYFLSNWATWTPLDWKLTFAVYLRPDTGPDVATGAPAGTCVANQSIMAKQFPIRRVVDTGSWVGRAHHGHGIGKEMRAAVLHFAFEGLGAQRAQTEAFVDNPASQRVTESLGYTDDGGGVDVQRDHARRVHRYALERDEWARRRRDDITLAGLEGALDMFGLDGSLTPLDTP
ncbi:MAG: GNAT family N-acetyltransferase [Acidimicrobiales bacterium]